jgi:hypothetical protein
MLGREYIKKRLGREYISLFFSVPRMLHKAGSPSFHHKVQICGLALHNYMHLAAHSCKAYRTVRKFRFY